MNMHLHCWKERLKVCKLTKLKCAKSAPNFPDVCMVEEGRGGAQICPLLTSVTLQSYIIVKSRSNLLSLLIVGGGRVRFRRVDGFSPVKS